MKTISLKTAATGLALFGLGIASTLVAQTLTDSPQRVEQRRADLVGARPAVKRGRMVNRVTGDPKSQLHERHDAGDFDTKTQDKITG